MILVDTSVIIDFWKRPTKALREVFEENEIFISGVTKSELLYGARSNNDFQKIINSLAVFQAVSISDDTWNNLGKNLFTLKKRGITVPFQDALIATIAIDSELELWTYDKHFSMIKNILPDLRLFRIQ